LTQPQPATPTIYRARKRWRRGTLAAASAVPIAALLAILAVHLLHAGASPSPTPAGSSVPVAVFNATGTPGAARRIADELKADRLHLGQIGNIRAHLSPGVHVLYPPGAQAQAQTIARLLPNLAPTVAPIHASLQDAVGQHDEIVVVFA